MFCWNRGVDLPLAPAPSFPLLSLFGVALPFAEAETGGAAVVEGPAFGMKNCLPCEPPVLLTRRLPFPSPIPAPAASSSPPERPTEFWGFAPAGALPATRGETPSRPVPRRLPVAVIPFIEPLVKPALADGT